MEDDVAGQYPEHRVEVAGEKLKKWKDFDDFINEFSWKSRLGKSK
jgi:hypothetical protein